MQWRKKHVGKPWKEEDGSLKYKEIFQTMELAQAACDRRIDESPEKESMQPYDCKYTDDFDEGESGPLHFHIGRPRTVFVRSSKAANRRLNKKIDKLKRVHNV